MIGILPRTLRLQTLHQFAARPPGLFVKPRLQFVGDKGEGIRSPTARFCFGLACAVGRISPSFQAARRPDRKRSRDGSTATSDGVQDLSAMSTRRFCAIRISLSNRTGSSRAYVCASAARIGSGVRGSASNRWQGVADDNACARGRAPSRSFPASVKEGWKKFTNSRTVA